MCHFITAVLPASADMAALDIVMRRHGRQLKPLSNPSVEAYVGRDERYYFTTRGYCDCGTALGAAADNKRSRRETIDSNAQAQRLRARGWSEAKIARALAQSSEQAQRKREADERRNAETAGMAEMKWLSCLRDVLASANTDRIGLLLHWYSGPLSGRIELEGRETVRIGDVDAAMLASMSEDVLYEFRR